MASTLTGTSTNAEVWAAYDNNASYEEDSSRTKALGFLTACRILLRRRPAASSNGDQSLTFDQGRITAELDAARLWLARNPASTTVRTRYADLTDYRDEAGSIDE